MQQESRPERDPNYGFDYPYVEFVYSSETNSSPVGRQGGRQEIKLVSYDRKTIVHEICHALGMHHEQCRVDRDDYITIHNNNIKDGKQHNFRKETSNYFIIGSFDFNSIMLYDSYSFTTNGNPTMTRKDGTTFLDNEGLSDLDRSFLNRFYIPLIARKDVCLELDKVVYDSNNRILTEQERISKQQSLNYGRCPALAGPGGGSGGGAKPEI